MTRTKQVVYDNFRFGVTPSGPPFKGRNNGEYRGYNAHTYRNGSLGIKPGWDELVLTGASFDPDFENLSGAMFRRDASDGAVGSIVLIYGDFGTSNIAIEEFNAETGASRGRHTVAAANFPKLSTVIGASSQAGQDGYWTWWDGAEVTAISGRIYTDFEHGGGTSTHPNTGDGYPAGAVVYKNRAYYFGFETDPGRIYYSVAGNYANWDDGTDAGNATWTSATSYFDINAYVTLEAGAVKGMWPVDNALLIACNDNRWFTLTGASPETGTLREIANAQVPFSYQAGAVMQGRYWFPQVNAEGIAMVSPGGIDSDSLKGINIWDAPGIGTNHAENSYGHAVSGCADITRDHLFFCVHENKTDLATNLQFIGYANGAWFYENYDLETAAGEVADVWMDCDPRNGLAYLIFNDESDSYAVLVREISLNRPAHPTVDYANLPTHEQATGFKADVWLNEVEADPGKIIRPVSFSVDFDYWSDAAGAATLAAPELAVVATVYGVDDPTDPDVAAASVDCIPTAPADTPSDRAPRRMRFSSAIAELPFGGSFDLNLVFDGIAIHRVVVEYEEQIDSVMS